MAGTVESAAQKIIVPQRVLDCVWESAPEDWRKHEKGGGWIYKTAKVDASAFIEGIVYGNALVYGNARVSGDAWEFSPLYIQGTRHGLTLCSFSEIAIGCHVNKIDYWKEHYKGIGRAEGYTDSQIAEYGRHISYIAEYAEALRAARGEQ